MPKTKEELQAAEDEVLETSEEEVIEDSVEDGSELEEGEDVQEFKASFGDPSEVPGPQTKKTDEKKKGKGDPMMKLDTKAGMMNAVMKTLAGMKKEEVEATLGKMFAEESDEEGYEQEEQAEEPTVEVQKLTTDDVDVSEDIDAITNGVKLTDEVKAKITDVFETALVTKINEQLDVLASASEADLANAKGAALDEMAEKVENYLDYVVSEWTEENRLAIEQGVRTDMVEDFLKGMKDLFSEHYVDIPEEKVEVVEELITRQEELETKLNEALDKNVELQAKVSEYNKDNLFAESVSDLTDTQVDKLRGLMESVEFVSEEDYSNKINLLKKQYFNVEIDESFDSIIHDDGGEPTELAEEQEAPSGAMAGYVRAITRSIQK